MSATTFRNRHITRRQLTTPSGHQCLFRVSTIYYVCEHNFPIRIADVRRGGESR